MRAGPAAWRAVTFRSPQAAGRPRPAARSGGHRRQAPRSRALAFVAFPPLPSRSLRCGRRSEEQERRERRVLGGASAAASNAERCRSRAAQPFAARAARPAAPGGCGAARMGRRGLPSCTARLRAFPPLVLSAVKRREGFL